MGIILAFVERERLLLTGLIALCASVLCAPSVGVAKVGCESDVVVVFCSLRLPIVLISECSILSPSVITDIIVRPSVGEGFSVAVGAVGIGVDHIWMLVRELRSAQHAVVVVFGHVFRRHITVELIHESRFDLNVDHVVFFSVVYAGMSCELVPAVIELKLLRSLGWQLCEQCTSSEDVFAVEQQLDGLPIPVKRAIVAHRHAGQLSQQVDDSGVILQFVRLWIEYDGVPIHRDAWQVTGDFYGLEDGSGGFHADSAEVDRVVALNPTEDVLSLMHGFVTKKGEGQ